MIELARCAVGARQAHAPGRPERGLAGRHVRRAVHGRAPPAAGAVGVGHAAEHRTEGVGVGGARAVAGETISAIARRVVLLPGGWQACGPPLTAGLLRHREGRRHAPALGLPVVAVPVERAIALRDAYLVTCRALAGSVVDALVAAGALRRHATGVPAAARTARRRRGEQSEGGREGAPAEDRGRTHGR